MTPSAAAPAVLSREDLAKASPAELARYKQLLQRDIARRSPLDLAKFLFPETRRWQHLEILNDHLVALTEYRLTAKGPRAKQDIRWEYRLEPDSPLETVMSPFDIPEIVDTYRAYDVTDNETVVFRLSIAMMPRAGKSRLVTETFPLWMLIHDPWVEIALGTYSDDFAKDWGGATRDLALRLKDEYPWLPQPAGGERASKEIFNVEGTTGKIRFSGVGGGLTGKGFQGLIGDDFIKNDTEAQSPASRKNAHGFYDTTWKSRKTRDLRPEARFPIPFEVLMATRWHESDVTGYACYDEEGVPRPDWCILTIPALCEDPATDPLHRPKGAAHPNAAGLTRTDLEGLRRDNATAFSSLYQGSPAPAEGNLISPRFAHYGSSTRDGVLYYTFTDEEGTVQHVSAAECITFASLDMAATKSTQADYTVLGVFRYNREHARCFIIDWYRDKITADEYVEKTVPFMVQHGVSVILVENVTYGQSYSQLMRRQGFRVDTMPAVADKVARMITSGLQAQVTTQGLLLPHGADFEAKLINEVGLFPNGDNDDQIDVLSFQAQYVQDLPRYRARPEPRELTLAEQIDVHVEKQAKARRTGRRKDQWSQLRR